MLKLGFVTLAIRAAGGFVRPLLYVKLLLMKNSWLLEPNADCVFIAAKSVVTGWTSKDSLPNSFSDVFGGLVSWLNTNSSSKSGNNRENNNLSFTFFDC